MALQSAELENRFGYHAATAASAPLHDKIRKSYQALAELINDVLPEGRDKSLALTELQTSMHWANSAVAMENPLITVDPERART